MSKNDIFDFRFNHEFKGRVMGQVLKEYFVHFVDKSELQVERILNAVKQVDGGKDERAVDM